MKSYKHALIKIIISFLIYFAFTAPCFCIKNKEKSQYKDIVSFSEKTERINWDWWKKFNDPVLLKILKTSVENNFNVIIADLKAKEAKNYIKSVHRGFFPSVKMSASYMETESSRIDSFGRLRFYSSASESIIYLPLEFSYEFDIWGKRNDKFKYFERGSDFAEFEKNLIIISTVTDVSTLYFNILKNKKLISLYTGILDLKRQKLEITLEKYKERLVSKTEIINAEKEFNIAKQELNVLKTSNEELKNKFYYLVCGDKEKVPVEFSSIDNIEIFLDKDVRINTASIALRPDVLMAENNIKMAKMDVKLAKKELLPSLFYKGDISQVTRLFNDFFISESIMYRIGYGLVYEMFQTRKNLAELDARKNIYKQVLKEYEKAIVSSLTDVNNSLIRLANSVKDYKSSKKISVLDKENLQTDKEKLDFNLIANEEIIDSAEKFLRSKISEYEAKTRCLIHSISLYKALGGNV